MSVASFITGVFEWIENRLDTGGWIRRAYLVLATGMTWKVIIWAMAYAEANAGRPGSDVALVIGAVAAIVATVQTFAFKSYLESRDAAAIASAARKDLESRDAAAIAAAARKDPPA